MTGGRLRNPVLLLAGVVLAVVAAATLPHDSSRRLGSPTAAPIAQQPSVMRPRRPGTSTSRDPEALPRGSRRDRGRVLAAAHRFARAFTRYEIGDLRPSVMLGLRRSAARPLLAELLDRPAHVAGGQRPVRARVIGVRDIRVRSDSAWAVIELRRDGRRTGLAVELTRAPAQFVVTKVA